MAIIYNEHQFVEENINKFEERMNSKYNRFRGNSQAYTTWFHINDEKSTVGQGTQDIEELIGEHSPLRFDKILHYPIYDLESIVLEIINDDQGLDTSYEGSITVVANTIKPFENDLFIIDHVKGPFIFRVNAVDFDTLKPNNNYKVSFMLDMIDNDKLIQLEKQVVGTYNCLLENIGTDKICIIEENLLQKVTDIENMYSDMVQTYLSIYYNETYNSLIGTLRSGRNVYDPLQTEFINTHELFNNPHDFQTIILSEQFTDRQRKIKYEKSIYRFIERNDVKLINNFNYTLFLGCTNPETTFSQWHDKSVYILDIPSLIDKNNSELIISDQFIEDVRINNKMNNKFAQTLKKYLKNEIKTLDDIDLGLNEALIRLEDSEEMFFFTPIILYIIKVTLDLILKV